MPRNTWKTHENIGFAGQSWVNGRFLWVHWCLGHPEGGEVPYPALWFCPKVGYPISNDWSSHFPLRWPMLTPYFQTQPSYLCETVGYIISSDYIAIKSRWNPTLLTPSFIECFPSKKAWLSIGIHSFWGPVPWQCPGCVAIGVWREPGRWLLLCEGAFAAEWLVKTGPSPLFFLWLCGVSRCFKGTVYIHTFCHISVGGSIFCSGKSTFFFRRLSKGHEEYSQIFEALKRC